MKYFNDKALPREENDTAVQGGIDTTDPDSVLPFEVDPDTGGQLVTPTSGFKLPRFDYFSVAYPDADTEVYTFKTGGSGGTTVATVTLNYTDSTKEFLSNGTITLP